MAKSLSQTPAPAKDRIKGSKVNPKGSASSEKSATKIKFDAKTIVALNNKLKEFREKHNNKNITLNDLKAVYRRGSGAYSSSHRPTISGGKPNSRNAWAMARVNAFLKKAGGGDYKKAYVQDDDLMKYENGALIENEFDEVLKSFYHDLTNSEIFDYLGLKNGNYTLGDNEFVIFRDKNFTNVEKIKIVSFIQPYFRNYQIVGKKIIIKLKDKYVNGGEVTYSRTYADGYVQKFSVDDYEKNVYPYLGKGGALYLAPNGKASNLNENQWKLVRTPEFKTWFGDWENDPANASQVIDENGEPLVCYHGTYYKEQFNVFDFDKADLGFHFGTYQQAKERSETKIKVDGYKRIVNPYFLNIKLLVETKDVGEWEYPQSYIDMFISDGLILENDAKKLGFYKAIYKEENKKIRDYLINKYNGELGFYYNNKIESEGESYLVLLPTQIKLADGTNTTFDMNNPDIRYADGGEIGQDIKCRRCGWEWNTSQSEEYDKYVCHNCGFDNRTFYDVDPIGYADGGKISNEERIKRNQKKYLGYDDLPQSPTEKVKGEDTLKGRYEYYRNHKELFGAFENGGEVDDKKKTYAKWKSLVNMSYGEIKKFYVSKEGKDAGLSTSEANKQGINSGRESARMLMKMKITSKDKWTDTMWKWANKQISFISRMSGNEGGLYDDKGNKTRKHTSLLIWGHNPKKNSSMKYGNGGLLAPNGKESNLTPEQYKLVRTPEFKAWFGDWENNPEEASKIVDNNGEPLMVYHGTNQKFTVFSLEKVGSNVDYGMWGSGFYFSPIRKFSKSYGSNLLKLFLNIRNPFVRNPNLTGSRTEFKPVYGKDESIKLRNEILSANYDGVVHYEAGEKNLIFQIVTFYPNQIKLADGKNTTFDVNNPDIRFADGGEMDVRMEDTVQRMDNPNFADISYYDKGGVLIPQQGTLYTKDKKSKLEYYKKGNDYAFKVYDVENNPVQNYTRNQYKNRGKDEVLMTYNQFISYLNSELYIDKKFANGGELKGLTQSEIDTNVHKIATKFKLPLEYINSQLKLGIKFEMEHTKDKSIASKIALDHLNESPYYYQKLSEMEKELDTMKMDADTYLPKVMSAYKNGGEVDMIFKLNTPTKQPTKLNYIQQILVRTTEFKKWFGDWEKCAESFLQDNKSNFLQHYKNCSIVIDLTTLEPQVVYHGTNFKEEFYTFDVTKKEGVGRPYGYFADNIEYSQNFTTNSQRGQHGLELLYKCFLNIRNPFMAITEDFYDELDNKFGWALKISKAIAKKNYGETLTLEQISETLKVVMEQIGSYIYATFGLDDKPFWLLMARDSKKEFKYFLMSHGFDGVRYAEEFKGVYDVDNPAEFTKAWTIFDANQVKLADGRNIDFDPFKEDIRYEEGGSLTELNQEEMQQENMSKAQMLRNTIGVNKFAEGGTVKGDGKHTNDAKKGGFFDGRSHAEGGIKAVNKDTGQLLEVEGNEVIINKRSVADDTKREFEGKMMTNREILSTINEMGGGVSFKEGGEINEKSCKCMGKKYKFGGNLISDYDIVKELTTSYNDVIKKPISNSINYVENLINKINGKF